MPRNKEFNEAEVLDKAIEIFWDQGYNATSYSDLVKHMGINRASIYNTYGDKKALFFKALQQYKKKNHDFLKKSLLRNLPIKQKMEEFFDMAIENALDDSQTKGCFIINSTTEMASCDQNIAGFVGQNRKDLVSLFTFLFQEAQVNGEISKDKDPQALADFIYNSYNGMQVTTNVKPGRAALENVKRLSISILS